MLRTLIIVATSVTTAGAFATPLPAYNVSWVVDSSSLTLTIDVATEGWVGFGLGAGSGMRGADMVWVDGEGVIKDGYALGKFTPYTDCVQDWTLVSRAVASGATSLVIQRALVTGDDQDHPVVDDGVATEIVVAYGMVGIFGYHGMNRATMQVNFFRPMATAAHFYADTEVKQISLMMHSGQPGTPYTVPVPGNYDAVTTLMDVCVDLPEEVVDQGAFIVGMEHSVVPGNEGLVHHYVLYGLQSSCAEFGGLLTDGLETGGDTSLKSLWAWQVGGGDYIFPPNLGYAIGRQHNIRALINNIHYDNPQMLSGLQDASGMVIHYTMAPRQYTMGILQFGDPMVSVEPSEVLIEGSGATKALHGFECPARYFAETNTVGKLKLFSTQMHMHRGGTYFRTQIVDWMGREKEVWKTELYDGNYQSRRDFNRTYGIESGDKIRVTCVWDDAFKSPTKDALRFGNQGDEEMCIDFVSYYSEDPTVVPTLDSIFGGKCALEQGARHWKRPIFDEAAQMQIRFGSPPAGKHRNCSDMTEPDSTSVTYRMYQVGPTSMSVGQFGSDTAAVTVVALHGFPQASGMWFPAFAPELSHALGGSVRVVAPDMRGFNRTTPKYECPSMSCEAYTPTAITAEVALLLTTHFNAEATPVHLVGHDWGAAIAWRVAIFYPQLVATLSVASVAHPSVFQQFLAHDERQIAASGYAAHLADSDSAYEQEKPMQGREDSEMVNEIIRASPEMEYAFKEAWLHEDSLRSGMYWYRGSREFKNISEGITGENMVVGLPVLQVWGAKDGGVLPRQICCLKSVVEQLHVKVVPDADHWLVDSHGYLFAKEVAKLIRGELSMGKCAAVEGECAVDRQAICDAAPGALPESGCDVSGYPETRDVKTESCDICRGLGVKDGAAYQDSESGERRWCEDAQHYCYHEGGDCGRCEDLQSYFVYSTGCCEGSTEPPEEEHCPLCGEYAFVDGATYLDPNTNQVSPCEGPRSACEQDPSNCGGCVLIQSFFRSTECCDMTTPAPSPHPEYTCGDVKYEYQSQMCCGRPAAEFTLGPLTTSCGAAKSEYKEQGCCGYPHKPFVLPHT